MTSLPSQFEFAAVSSQVSESGLPLTGYCNFSLAPYYSNHDSKRARVHSVSFIKQPGSFQHEYLSVRVVIDNQEGFLCFERSGGSRMSIADKGNRTTGHPNGNDTPKLVDFIDSTAKTRYALDNVKLLSQDRQNIQDEELARLEFSNQRPTLYEVAILACVAHDTRDYYTLGSDTYYWFSGFLFSLLRMYTGAKSTHTTSKSNMALGQWKKFFQTYRDAEEELNQAMTEFYSRSQKMMGGSVSQGHGAMAASVLGAGACIGVTEVRNQAMTELCSTEKMMEGNVSRGRGVTAVLALGVTACSVTGVQGVAAPKAMVDNELQRWNDVD